LAKEREPEENKTPEEEEQNSGVPGGGVGRKDEVGRSGVYPVSGPEWPPGNAPVVSQGSWGQGERGEKGYENHGESSLEGFWEEEKKARDEK